MATGKILRKRTGERLFEPAFTRGCSSVVEHLLAKEDVASSSLVTRSSLRLVRSAKGRLERARRSPGGGGPPDRIQLRLASQLETLLCITSTFCNRNPPRTSDTSV